MCNDDPEALHRLPRQLGGFVHDCSALQICENLTLIEMIAVLRLNGVDPGSLLISGNGIDMAVPPLHRSCCDVTLARNLPIWLIWF